MPRTTAKRPAAAERPAEIQLSPIHVAADKYGVDWQTVRRWISTGLITGYRLGDRQIRVDLDEIEAKVVQKIPAADAGR